jgi:hypothetical protein
MKQRKRRKSLKFDMAAARIELRKVMEEEIFSQMKGNLQ